MKRVVILVLAFFQIGHIQSQTFVKFDENGLMNNASAFGAILCPLDSAKASNVLNETIKLNVPQKHVNGYCEVRAHFLAKKLSPLVSGPGCEVGKIWAFSPSIYTLMWNKKLATPNPLFEGDTIKWDYHVAPLFALQNGSSTDTVVLDFSFNNKGFINYHDWLQRLNCPEAIYTFTDDDYYLFYTLEGLKLTGARYNNYTTPSNLPKIITGHFWYLANTDKTSIPSGLAYNELAIYLAEKYYRDTQYAQYKEAIKNATKLNEMKQIVAGTFSGLPKEITDASKKYYNDRFAYWTKHTP